ncbi:hypothetical protein [Spiroplasma eriocheiris]|uniref:Uncharacterized protein n=1 Tax=Spiroplasma eriocheiris TaxID=315358 RepID=A0A0H3XI34_9MOLU|nr:hypothetical protein [Spiroplasma eriocheiris]AHF58052.1 hypothetical protein SPE_0932 [Spiroplasma eriocheiris CCTCC M 207170]AKM54493.1 hypothetical protein SERIO_v1c09330 [Spiroplasma eriocheiris]
MLGKNIMNGEYQWDLSLVNDRAKMNVIHGAIKTKANLLKILNNTNHGFGLEHDFLVKWKHLFFDFQIINCRNQELNDDGLYNYFDVALYNKQKDKYKIITILVEPDVINYPLDNINFEANLRNDDIYYLECRIFFDKILLNIKDFNNKLTLGLLDSFSNILAKAWVKNNLISENNIKQSQQFYDKFLKILSSSWIKRINKNPNIKETKITKLIYKKIRYQKKTLKQFITYKIKNNQDDRYTFQQLGEFITSKWEKINSKNNVYKYAKYNYEEIFEEFIDLCEQYYDYDICEYYFYGPEINEHNSLESELFYKDSEIRETIQLLEEYFLILRRFL